jgi:hypothetical protein
VSRATCGEFLLGESISRNVILWKKKFHSAHATSFFFSFFFFFFFFFLKENNNVKLFLRTLMAAKTER